MALALAGTSISAASSASAADGGYVQVPDSAYVLAPGDTDLGSFPNDPVRFELSLKLRNSAAAEAQALDVSDPASPNYGHFLTAAQVQRLYSPTDRQFAVLTSWLRGAGLQMPFVSDSRTLVTSTGTVRAADRAFRTHLHRIADSTGFVFTAPITPLYVPSGVDSIANGFIEGINKAQRLTQPLHETGDGTTRTKRTSAVHIAEATATSSAPPDFAFVNARPCSAYWGEKTATGLPELPDGYASESAPYAPCGYTPAQLAGAYGTAAGYRAGLDGRGVTVAVVDAYASPTIEQDIATYAAKNGPAAWKTGQFRQQLPASFRLGYDDQVNGDQCGEQGWYGEETLDIEAVHGLAPGANVLYVGTASCFDGDILNSFSTLVDRHQADIITNSYGDLGEAAGPITTAWHQEFIQAALEGIGVFFSSGDNGDEVDTIADRQTDSPANDPLVTAVGGTSLGVGRRNNYLFEAGWGTTKSVLTDGAWSPAAPGAWIYGGGGGTSRIFDQPRYQRGVVPGSIANYFGPNAGRSVPDIAAVGDPTTGFLVGQTQTFPDGSERYSEYRIGGTSLSSPVMAGIEAVADQAAGRAHGFANPAIYRLASSSAVHDVVDPSSILSAVRVDFINGTDATDGLRTSLRTMNQTESLATRPGYDDVTGVGTPTSSYVTQLGR